MNPEPTSDGRASAIADENAIPIPPRFRWLKRLSLLGGCLLVALLGLRLWWGYEADRRLRQVVERYQAAGELVYAAEFDAVLDAVPDEENKALLLATAISGIVATTASGFGFDQIVDQPEILQDNREAAAELFQANAPVLDLVRQARFRPAVAWSERLEGLAASFTVGLGSGQRALAKLLWFAAYYQFQQGDHAAAIETFKDSLAFGEAVGAHPTVLSSLVAQGSDGLTCAFVEHVGSRLSVAGGQGLTTEPTRSATRSQVEELIDMLLNEGPCREAAIRSYRGDRAGDLDNIDFADAQARQGGLWGRVAYFATRPLFVLDTIRAMELSTLAAQAAGKPTWPEADAHFPSETQPDSWLRSLTRPITVSVWGDAGKSNLRGIELHFRLLARRRMTATALAIRLFEVDHGRRPATLTELVPAYLPRVPPDPFLPDGGGIRYKPDARPAVLYALGGDGKDDGGEEPRRKDGRIDTERFDIVFYLDGKPKRVPPGAAPSTQAVHDDENVEDDRGEADEGQEAQGEPNGGHSEGDQPGPDSEMRHGAPDDANEDDEPHQ